MTKQITPKEVKEVLETTEVTPLKRRLVELRLLGKNLNQCVTELKEEGFSCSYDVVSKMWGNTNLDPMIDEMLRRQFADLEAVAEMIKKSEIAGELVTIDHKLKGFKIIMQYRDRLLTKFMSKPSGGNNTQVNVIVPPEPIPIINTK